MSRRLKVGVVGGGIGISHIEAYQALPDLYSVEAICDIDAGRAGKVAAEKGIPKAMTRFDDIVALDLDILDIATPPDFHVPQTLQALSAGHHVVVEKPLASSLADVDAVAAAERKSGHRVSPVFQYRFGNGLARLRHLIAKGVAGTPRVATLETHWRRTATYYAAGPWRGRWQSELGGCLASHAIHIHDLLMQILGPLARVYALTATRVNPIETEDCAALSLEFADGTLATSSVTLGSTGNMSRMRFCFEGLTAESGLDPYNPGHEPWSFSAADEEGRKRIDEALADFVPGHERWIGQFYRLHSALIGGGPLPVTVADARASIELLTAAYYSSRTGEAVALPIGQDHPFYEGWVGTMAAGDVDA